MDGPVELEALYALVPAAEEEDLLEEVAADRVQHEWETMLRHGRCLSCWYLADGPVEECCAVPPVVSSQAPSAGDEGPALTAAQVLALVVHELGGVVVEGQGQAGIS